MSNKYIPLALFDTNQELQILYKDALNTDPRNIFKQYLRNSIPESSDDILNDFQQALHFLYSYRGSEDTFNAYRREVERFLHWSWFVRQQSVTQHKRLDIEAFIEFCQNPPVTWIATKTVKRFILKDGMRVANSEWRPFNVKVSKRDFQDGKRADCKKFELSQKGLKVMFAVLGSFYNYLIQEEQVAANPIAQIRQKSKFIQKQQPATTIRRLSTQQWQVVIDVANHLAAQNPQQHERTLFILSALYGMFLRISELVATRNWTPTMGDFFRDTNHDWWFKTVGKGNKERQIAVSDAMLIALKRWRHFLELPPLPIPGESTPLIPTQSGKQSIRSTRSIRQIVQNCFDEAVMMLRQTDPEEAELLRSATVHWLRHTGISDDVKVRPREHVRDDAGHSSSAITDKYIDVELKARHASAKEKIIDELADDQLA